MKPNSGNEHGHIDLGVTLTIFIIIGGYAYLAYVSNTPGETPYITWLSWPWWGKGLSIIIPIALFLIGRVFEDSRKWPKLSSGDDPK